MVKKSGPNAGLGIPYDPRLLIEAQTLLLKDVDRLQGSDAYRFDIVDVQRQIMTNLAQNIHKSVVHSFNSKNQSEFILHSNRFLELLQDVDDLLRTRSEFNFDNWLSQARSWGDNDFEKNLLERDATALVTIWGADKDPLIFDYSWREWTGLIEGYYLERWKKFYSMLSDCLKTGKTYSEDGLPLTHGREAFRANKFYNDLGNWELKYVSTINKVRTPIIEGDEVEMVKLLFQKYLKLSEVYYNNSSLKNSPA